MINETRGEFFARRLKELNIKYKDIPKHLKIRSNYIKYLNREGITLKTLQRYADVIESDLTELVQKPISK